MRGVLSVALAALLAACARDLASPSQVEPAALEVVEAPELAATVGEAVGPFSVRLVDDAGAPLAGRTVAFTVSRGNGSVSPAIVQTNVAGIAATDLTVGTTPGSNEFTAVAAGVDPVSVEISALAGDPAAITFTARWFRLLVGQDSIITQAIARDQYGNAVSLDAAWSARDPAVAEVTPRPNGTVSVRALQRPAHTWLIASAGDALDSVRFAAVDAVAPCTGLASPVQLALGEHREFSEEAAVCLVTPDTAQEFVAIVHNGSPAAGTAVSVGLIGHGTAPAGELSTSAPLRGPTSAPQSFELELRRREREQLPRLVAAQRASRPAVSAATPPPSGAIPDLVTFNVNPESLCDAAEPRGARLRAVGASVAIYEDTLNPPGGFAAEDYDAIVHQIDTLVMPVIAATFGPVTDLDGNQRVILLFTRRVNGVPTAASSLVLGFFVSRDLLARPTCASSNEAEVIYLLAPDPGGVAGPVVSSDFVNLASITTVTHELQHLVNASSRLHFTPGAMVTEDIWLNEGLSHIAEEEVFYRASGLGPGGNIGAAELAAGTDSRAAFEAFLRPNFERYRAYLQRPDANSPITDNDQLATRGAAWSFLRFVSDHAAAGIPDFWKQIVTSRTSGLTNLDEVLAGATASTLDLLRNWSVAVFTDDLVAGGGGPVGPAALAMPSWDFRGAMGALGSPLDFALIPLVLSNEVTTSVGLINGGSDFLRFSVAPSQQALVRVSGAGFLQPGIRLTIVRIK